jgi:peptidoglycan-associated lipoprotein
MRDTWKLAVCALAGAMYLGGCAHPAAVAKAAVPAPAPVVKATPAAAEAPAPADQAAMQKEREAKDLADLLQGTVIHFDFDAAVLTPESRTRLQRLADAMRAHPGVQIRISGNTDDRGTEEYNLALGQKRAAVAKKYLADLGVEQGRIDTVSYGKERPVDARETEEAWSANRRDDFAATRGL